MLFGRRAIPRNTYREIRLPVLYRYVSSTYLVGYGMVSLGKRQASPEITRFSALKCARSDESAATGAVRVAGRGCRAVRFTDSFSREQWSIGGDERSSRFKPDDRFLRNASGPASESESCVGYACSKILCLIDSMPG